MGASRQELGCSLSRFRVRRGVTIIEMVTVLQITGVKRAGMMEMLRALISGAEFVEEGRRSRTARLGR